MFNGLLFGWTLLLFWPNLKFVALPVSEIIAIEVSSDGLRSCEPPILGKRRPYRGSGMVSFTPPLVSSKFTHVPPMGGWPLGYEERRCWANAISFRDFQPMWSCHRPDPPTSRTDRRKTCDRKTALCTIVHRAVKMLAKSDAHNRVEERVVTRESRVVVAVMWTTDYQSLLLEA